MLKSDSQTRYPPVGHIGMIPIRDMNRSPTAEQSFVLVIEPLQPMQIMKIPGERSMFPVDLERIKRLMTPGVPGRLEGRQRSILKPARNALASSIPTRLHFAG